MSLQKFWAPIMTDGTVLNKINNIFFGSNVKIDLITYQKKRCSSNYITKHKILFSSYSRTTWMNKKKKKNFLDEQNISDCF